MKLNLTLLSLAALAVPALAAPTPVVVEERAPGYADYGAYPPPAGGYGAYTAYPTASPAPLPTSYG